MLWNNLWAYKNFIDLVKNYIPRKAPLENILKASLAGNEIYLHKNLFTCVEKEIIFLVLNFLERW